MATDDDLRRSIQQTQKLGASTKVPKSALESAARLGRVITQIEKPTGKSDLRSETGLGTGGVPLRHFD
jgi:hypothetical protein